MNEENKKGFTLIEVLAALALVLILSAVFVSGGRYLKIRAERQLTQTAIEIVCTTLNQYYEEYKAFPFKNRDTNLDQVPDPYTKAYLEWDTSGTVFPAMLTLEEKAGDGLYVSYASSPALFYFLDQDKNCRQVIEAISERLITNKDPQTQAALTISVGTPTTIKDLPRFIDAWGMSLRYEYLDGYSFPIITSAGPDKVFGTKDDLKSQ